MITDVQKHLPEPSDIRSIISRRLLADGFKMVLDMEKSQGMHLHDAATGRDYVDFDTLLIAASRSRSMKPSSFRSFGWFIPSGFEAKNVKKST